MNRFRELDLVDRVPEQLWMEVHYIIQEEYIWKYTGTYTYIIFPKEKIQEGKVIVWGGFTNIWEKEKIERQGRKGKIYPTEYGVPEKSKET